MLREDTKELLIVINPRFYSTRLSNSVSTLLDQAVVSLLVTFSIVPVLECRQL